MVDFGERLRLLRKRANLSQEQLASRLSVTKSVVSSYETGMRMPSYSVLGKIARVFNVTTDYLLGIDNTETMDISGLTETQKDILSSIVSEFRKNSSKNG